MASSSTNGYADEEIKIPSLDASLIPEPIKIPKDLWKEIYLLLLESPRQMLKPTDLNVQYSRKYKRSLGGKELWSKCHAKNLISLICALPDVEPYKSDGQWYFRLRDRNSPNPRIPYRDKVQKMESKPKKHSAYSDEEASEDEGDQVTDVYDNFDDEGNSGRQYVPPPQPQDLIPPGARLPDDLRQRIYALLSRKFPDGVEVDVFKQEYSKFYGRGINNNRDCSLTEAQLFHALNDCIANKPDEMGKLWIKARTEEDINYIHDTRPDEIFKALAPVKEKRVGPFYRKPGAVVPTASHDPRDNGFLRVDPKTVLFDDRPEPSKSSSVAATCSSSGSSSSSSSINKAAMVRVIALNMRSNTTRENERHAGAQDNLDRLQIGPKVAPQPTPLTVYTAHLPNSSAGAHVMPQPQPQDSPPYEYNDLELLYEALSALSGWKQNKYHRKLKLPNGMKLLQALEHRPEMFVLTGGSQIHSVKARRLVNGLSVDSLIYSNPIEVVDFGLQAGTVYSGSFDSLRLEIGETDLEVYVSFVNDHGEFCLQLANMEPRFSELEYDMTQFYSDCDSSGIYELSIEYIKIGFPVALLVNTVWHRGVISYINDQPGVKYPYEVRDIDFGKTYWVNRTSIRFLRRCYVDNCVPPCGIFAKLANIIPDPHKWRLNSRDVIDDCLANATGIFINVVSVIPDDNMPEVLMTVHYGQKQPSVDVSDVMVKRGFAIARITRDNDLALDDPPLPPAPSPDRIDNRLNRFTCVEEDGLTSCSPIATNDVNNFNFYGPEAVAQMLSRSKSNPGPSNIAQNQRLPPDSGPLPSNEKLFPVPPPLPVQTSTGVRNPPPRPPSVTRNAPNIVNQPNTSADLPPMFDQENQMNELKAIADILSKNLTNPNLTEDQKEIYQSQLLETTFKLAQLELESMPD